MLALLLLSTVRLLAGCATPAAPLRSAAAVEGGNLVIVAVAEAAEVRGAAGAAARVDYRQARRYFGGDAAQDTARTLAEELRLQEVKAWTIPTLQWRCMLYRLPPGSEREAVLARLAADPRVALAQALQEFETLAGPEPASHTSNDPYLALQTGYAAIDAGRAQSLSRGVGVTVAVIDTGVDIHHPELATQLRASRDFVGGATDGETHGTAVAGVIAAAANNGIGIAGVAPGAQLLALRACWNVGPGLPARCNSFTLAQALSEAMAAGADIINLSLGGPRDPLLERLATQAMARGAVIVGATPPGGRRGGFPSALPGVVAVAAAESAAEEAGVLRAPGLRVLTLAPAGGYDYASGSSLATAHVSGAIALLRAVQSRLDGTAAGQLLAAEGGIDACRALLRQRPARPITAACSSPR